MINILILLEAIDFEPCDEDADDLHKYLNKELNGIDGEMDNRPKKYFKNLLKYIKTIIKI